VTTSPYSDSLSLGLRILLLNPATSYKSPAHSSTGTRSGLFSSHCLSAYGFMFFFTPLRGFYFTFPSLYFFTIGHSGVFSLTRWSSQIHTGFHVPHATRDFPNFQEVSTTGLSPSMVQDSAASSLRMRFFCARLFSLKDFSASQIHWIPTTPRCVHTMV